MSISGGLERQRKVIHCMLVFAIFLSLRVRLSLLVKEWAPTDIVSTNVPSFMLTLAARTDDDLIITPPIESLPDHPIRLIFGEVAVHLMIGVNTRIALTGTWTF